MAELSVRYYPAPERPVYPFDPRVEAVAKALFEVEQEDPAHEYSNLILYGSSSPVTWASLFSPEISPFMADQYRERARKLLSKLEGVL